MYFLTVSIVSFLDFSFSFRNYFLVLFTLVTLLLRYSFSSSFFLLSSYGSSCSHVLVTHCCRAEVGVGGTLEMKAFDPTV